MDDEVKVPAKWLERLSLLGSRVERQFNDLDLKTKSRLLGSTDFYLLLGYISSAEAMIKPSSKKKKG